MSRGSHTGSAQSPRSSHVSVDVLGVAGPEFHELCELQGPLFQAWLECWADIPESQRETYTHPVWVASWLRAYCPEAPDDFRVLVFREGTRLVAVLPVERHQRKSALGRIHWYAHPENAAIGGASLAIRPGYRDAVLEKALATEAWPGFRPFMLRFGRVDEGSPLLEPPRHLGHVALHGGLRAVLSLDGGWEAVWSRTSRGLKRGLRWSFNQLKRTPNVQVDEFTKSPEIEEAFESLIEVEARGWKARQGQKADAKKAEGRSMAELSALGAYFAPRSHISRAHRNGGPPPARGRCDRRRALQLPQRRHPPSVARRL